MAVAEVVVLYGIAEDFVVFFLAVFLDKLLEVSQIAPMLFVNSYLRLRDTVKTAHSSI